MTDSLDLGHCCDFTIIAQCWRQARIVARGWCCDRKARAASAQSFALWQQATIEITRRDHSPRALVITSAATGFSAKTLDSRKKLTRFEKKH